MKLTTKYSVIKHNHSEFIVLIESGVFIYSYNDDALILNYLFSYQIKDNTLGFPKIKLERIIDELQKRHINYIFNEEEVIYNDNQYNNLLYNAKKDYLLNSNIDLLIENIKFKINEDEKNLNKIRNFVDEL